MSELLEIEKRLTKLRKFRQEPKLIYAKPTIQRLIDDLEFMFSEVKSARDRHMPRHRFVRLDYENLPEDGLYWLLVERPEAEADLGDNGETIGAYTGQTERFVTMGLLTQNADGEPEVDFIDAQNYRRCEVWEITAFASLNAPEIPGIVFEADK